MEKFRFYSERNQYSTERAREIGIFIQILFVHREMQNVSPLLRARSRDLQYRNH